MTTKIPVELSSTPSIVDNGDATAITIDSSEQVGIGTTSPHTTMVVNGGTQTQISLQSSNSGTGANQGSLLSIDTSNNLYLWNYENLPTLFGTNNTEKMRILAEGGITFNGDTAAANALDDYEQGAWTPVAGGVTTSVSFAYYTKIGNLVYAQFYVNFVPANNSSQFQITGLPYSSTRGYGGGSLGYVASVNMSDILSPIVNSNGTFAYFHKNNGDGSSLSNANLYSKSSGRHYLLGSVTYQHG